MKKEIRERLEKHSAAGGREAEFYRIRRQLGFAFTALILVIAIGVVGFMIIGRGQYSMTDALYMTIITLTTVGFSEIIGMAGNPAGRIFTIFLILGGMGIVAYSMAMLAAFIIEGQLRHIFYRKRIQRRIARMTGHYIVCGNTTVKLYVLEELIKTGRSVVLVAPTQEEIDTADERLGDIPGIVGDPSDDDILLKAGLHNAAGVVFCMENHKDNLLGVLTARRLTPEIRIIAATELMEIDAKLKAAGADSVVSPSRIGGLRMASELIRPTVVTFLDQMLRVGVGDLRIEEVHIPDSAAAAGLTIGSLQVNEIEGALLLAICRSQTGEYEYKPSPDTPLESGVILVVMTDLNGRTLLEERLKKL